MCVFRYVKKGCTGVCTQNNKKGTTIRTARAAAALVSRIFRSFSSSAKYFLSCNSAHFSFFSAAFSLAAIL